MAIGLLTGGVSKTDASASTGEDVVGAVNAINKNQCSDLTVCGIDLHYGALMGVGWRSGETGGAVQYPIDTPAAAGDVSIVLDDATNIVAGQLISVFDGELYWTHFVSSKSTNTLTVSPPLRADAVSVFNFYNNESHPNVYGYRAICDYALSRLKLSDTVVTNCYIRRNAATSTIVANANNAALNTGSAGVSAYDVTTTTVATQGLYGNIVIDSEGDYIAEVCAFCATSDVKVFVAVANTQFSELIIPAGAMGRHKLNFTTSSKCQKVTIRVAPVTSGATATVSELVKIKRVSRSQSVAELGTHVMIGDSWFTQVGFTERLQERLPEAVIINKAQSGRASAAILSAFDTDLAGLTPDYVWYTCGTNDYYGSITAAAFRLNFDKTKAKILATGAKPVMLNSSVGSADLGTTRFNLSRQYATIINNDNSDLQASFARQAYSIPFTTVANGSNQQLVNLGTFVERVSVNYYYVNGAGVTLRHKQSMTGSGTSLLTLSDNSPVSTVTNYHFDGDRWLDLFATNSSGGSLTYTGFIEITRDF